MNLIELRLLAFGPFTGLTLDLSEAPALHLVYGPNEAGKSTTLRAITGLLYGIHATTLDAHRHRMSELRIGARVGDGNGTVIDVIRRKGLKNTLLDAESQPLDEAVLRRLLGGVSESLFRTMFGLGHESLRAGGEALLRGQGDVGETLFDAGVGGPGIHRVLEDLRREADEIFRPQAQNPRLNQAIALFLEAEKHSRDNAVAAEAWFAQREEIERASRERDELQAQRRSLVAEQARLQRSLRVLPLLAKHRQLSARRADLGDVVTLAADATDQRLAAERAAESATLQLRRLEESIAALCAKRDGLAAPAPLAGLEEEAVGDLQQRLGAHRSAAADLPKRRAELQSLDSEMRRLLRDLGRGDDVGAIERLRLPAAAQSRLRALAKRQSGLEKDLEHASTDLAERKARLAGAEDRLGHDGIAPGTSLPGLESVDRFAAERQQLEGEETELRRTERELRQRSGSIAAAVEELRLLGDVPTEDQLQAARRRRDELWRELLSRLGRAGARAAAEPFAAALRDADDLADRLRREAERSGRLANLTAARHELDEQLRLLERERDGLSQRRQAHAEEWAELWKETRVTQRTPAEMRAWLVDRRRAGEVATELEREVALADERRTRAQAHLDTWRRQWGDGVAALGLGEAASVEETEEVLEKLGALFAKSEEAGRLRARITAMERDAERLRADVGTLVRQHAADLAGAPFEESAELLVRRHREALDDDRRRCDLGEEIDAKRSELDELREQRSRADDTLRLLQRAGGVSSPAELEAAERRSAEALQLERGRQQVENDLLEAGDGEKLEALAALTRDLDPDSARARLVDIEAQIEEVTDAVRALERKIGACESGLQNMEGRTGAVEAAAEAQEHAAAIRSLVRRYLRARLAATVLEQEVERYRQQNQGPILKRANELFPRLTLGHYVGLTVGFDARDQGVLLCVRDDGSEVGVEGLSDGTRDQLYLALRLASLERYLALNPAMPVVLDDILIHFDDERARAALAVLGEFAQRAQVLFFTHHARLVELARDVVPGVIEHRLA